MAKLRYKGKENPNNVYILVDGKRMKEGDEIELDKAIKLNSEWAIEDGKLNYSEENDEIENIENEVESPKEEEEELNEESPQGDTQEEDEETIQRDTDEERRENDEIDEVEKND